ncbi:MAG: SIS domain-containing protein [Planctomycetes bacterium]|nr:SIS domain-containing protein [Planctomycetota bacterium]
MSTVDYVQSYLDEVQQVAREIHKEKVAALIDALVALRERGGRLFFVGVGGSAGSATHAVNDFRKIAGIEAYTPTDNVSELTARINDDGWEGCFAAWLHGSRLTERDALFVLSVGGGNEEKQISTNIVEAIKYARSVGAKVFGIVGRDGGYTAKTADVAVVVPTVNSATVTPHTEEFHGVLWHLIVSHPALKAHEMKWETLAAP